LHIEVLATASDTSEDFDTRIIDYFIKAYKKKTDVLAIFELSES
jgi:molecular chaperone DnaK (HSP70)